MNFDNNLIKETSRKLRKNRTDAEYRLWYFLRNRKLNGKKFIRQYPIKIDVNGEIRFFIADFYCDESKLVVEIESSIHDDRKEQDSYRSLLINCYGINVVRYSNDAVLYNTNEVLENLSSLL